MLIIFALHNAWLSYLFSCSFYFVYFNFSMFYYIVAVAFDNFKLQKWNEMKWMKWRNVKAAEMLNDAASFCNIFIIFYSFAAFYMCKREVNMKTSQRR